MFFKKRIWQVIKVNTPEELAEKLTNYTWTLCTGFKLGDYYFLNDSTSENGAQEYAVLKDTGEQIESITLAGELQRSIELYKQSYKGEYDNEAWNSGIDINTAGNSEQHGRCPYCA